MTERPRPNPVTESLNLINASFDHIQTRVDAIERLKETHGAEIRDHVGETVRRIAEKVTLPEKISVSATLKLFEGNLVVRYQPLTNTLSFVLRDNQNAIDIEAEEVNINSSNRRQVSHERPSEKLLREANDKDWFDYGYHVLVAVKNMIDLQTRKARGNHGPHYE